MNHYHPKYASRNALVPPEGAIYSMKAVAPCGGALFMKSYWKCRFVQDPAAVAIALFQPSTTEVTSSKISVKVKDL